jgi:hypothetical protein
MSYEEKGTWVSLGVTIATAVIYAVIVGGAALSTPIARVQYGPALLWIIGISIVASIVVRVVVEILTPSDSYRVDARDKAIARRGGYVLGMVVAIGMVIPLVLAIVQAHPFWIANAIYGVYVVASLTGGVVQLVAYRRGF